MEDAVCRDDKRDMRVVIVAFEAGDGAASFAGDDDTGGGIPRFEVYLPKAIEPASGDAAQVEGSGTGASDGVDFERDVAEVFVVWESVVVRTDGKARG